ncbi:hypothetical protein HRbin14_02073 [bacterium HR14]|nr:hypothetical protein HRbin14_02073 [bacterium HR14]
MRHALRPVHQTQRARLMRQTTDFRHRVHRAQHIGHMGHGDHARAFAQQAFESFQFQPPLVGDAPHDHLCARFLRHAEPRDQVRVVFHLGENNLVARFELASAPCVGNEVDAFGGAACENDFSHFAGVKELRHASARTLIEFGRLRAHPIRPAMHIGVIVRPEMAHRLNHAVGFVGGGGVIEINQAPHFGVRLEERELLAYLAGV